MKKILAVLIAALMICLSVVPAMAVFPVGDALYFVGQCIELYNTSAQIHEAYADTIQKAMDYRKYYNEQGLAKAYDKMQVSMRNTGTPSYKSVLNTTNNTFYDMSRDYTYTYNTAYYNNTYNSYYIPVTYNDVDYNYFITYAPTYTNITYIVDGCNDPSQAVSNNYYFQLPDGRNSYNLTADDVFGIPLSGEVINYDAVPENDNCVALYHFDGNIVDVSGNGNTAKFADGTVPQYISSSSFGKHLMLANRGRLDLTLSEALEAPYTIEIRLNFGEFVSFSPLRKDLKETLYSLGDSPYWLPNEFSHTGSLNVYRDSNIILYVLRKLEGSFNYNSFNFNGLDSGVRNVRFGVPWFSNTVQYFDFESPLRYYAKNKTANIVELPDSLVNESMRYKIRNYISSVSTSHLESQFFNFSKSIYNDSNPFPLGQWVDFSIVNDGSTLKYYLNGVAFTPPSYWTLSTGNLNSFTFYGSPGFSYTYFDELRVSKGALYTSNYTPASAPFDIPLALVLPSEKTEGAIAVKSAVAVNNVRFGGVRPSYPAQGDVYISLDADKKVTSCQQYQSGTWTECQGSVCKDDNWVELTGYSFAGRVVNEDDFAEVIDKKDDPAIGSNSNPDAEVTSFTVHYYKDGTTDKLRRDTVYQNVAVGSSFAFSPPAIKNYKPLVSSAEITISADGEHIFYYAANAGSGGGSGGESDPSKPGFFDGLLSGVKSLVNVVCGFLGGVVQSVLSGITGIISTLIEAFKSVLSLGGHFGDFLAAALGFVPREIIDLLIAGIAVSIALAIVKFIRG